jgi:hypothetical protein
MPNRYEREIEEILRNLEHTEPKAIRGQRSNTRTQRGPSPSPRIRRQRRQISLSFSATEWLLIIAVVAALIAGGYAFTLQSAGPGGIFTPILVAISLVCLILVALSYYLFRPRGPKSPRPVHIGNATVTPLRRGFFSDLKTRWHLFVLKLRYQRRNDP